MTLKVTEIFSSVQGEGPNIGLPAIFLRLSGCNLSCSFCDTKYALTEGKELTVEEVSLQIQKLQRGMSYSGGKRLIITGGEPLCQQEELTKFLSIVKQPMTGFIEFVEIETNGTIVPTKEMIKYVDSWIVSPKSFPLQIETQQFLHKPVINKTHLKFVINSTIDIHNLLEAYTQFNHLIPPEQIFLMPCATSITEQFIRLPMIIKTAKTYGFRVTPRLHIIAYGNVRGV